MPSIDVTMNCTAISRTPYTSRDFTLEREDQAGNRDVLVIQSVMANGGLDNETVRLFKVGSKYRVRIIEVVDPDDGTDYQGEGAK
jgi:hypothetical protein